jgi:hypothetical protein
MTGRRFRRGNGNKKSKQKRRNNNDREGMTLAELAVLMKSSDNNVANSCVGDGGDDTTEKTSYLIATAGQALRMGQALGANVLIVDPPRRGLEDDVLDCLCQPYNPDQLYVESTTFLTIPDERMLWTNDVQTLIYVSCGFDALARDCDRLLSSSAGWTLQSSTGYILFPGSDHVETLAIFNRK